MQPTDVQPTDVGGKRFSDVVEVGPNATVVKYENEIWASIYHAGVTEHENESISVIYMCSMERNKKKFIGK